MNTNHQKLLNNFEILKLKKFKDYYPNYIELLSKNEKSLTEILIDLTEKEIEYQSELKFKRAVNSARFPNKTLKQLSRIELLIIDEIGYTPITKEQADLFYQLMSLRYEWKSTIITTNIPFSSWGESFSNKIVSAAIIDRLVHHSKVFKITGESYRLKDYKTEKSLNIRQS
ncbi:TPA: ATP-binding protein [Staphylococcus aureus]|uniref:ATP-binding protein n=1 Tax=Staphylococcus aureus TaxID=1280 RepID=UPI0018881AB2|nr:ATP-binding protein [Staphylococcus aureus]MBF2712626.1 ATP-binding protein [Staphylococcus aureus]MBU7239867.1 ATP-binding protein [Staphylococcus aureus]